MTCHALHAHSKPHIKLRSPYRSEAPKIRLVHLSGGRTCTHNVDHQPIIVSNCPFDHLQDGPTLETV